MAEIIDSLITEVIGSCILLTLKDTVYKVPDKAFKYYEAGYVQQTMAKMMNTNCYVVMGKKNITFFQSNQ
ncbi:unnamed protein product [Callosobruchus maculatus]|uniref:Uncharacterized protein n=1 Tax=Callosobruchus maculatus TaxID=64391 RepID=A0A653BMD7_CALMS|nr:unnamed protein product [Callosobruchus maculatus]